MNNIDLQLLGMVQNTSWAMHLPKLDEISLFFEKRINGVNIDFAKTADMQDGITADKTYQVQDSIAIIPIFGSLLKRANLMTSISGGTSMQILEREIAKALSDDDVEGILLNVDSPGGTVDGTKQLADFIYNNRGTKPIVAFTDGMMCSAAYWIASAADCRIAYDTSLVGSIGVATVHYDRSGADEKDGVKRTIITAGKFKQITNDANPLSDEARKLIQTELDDIYAMFLSDVSRNIGVDKAMVLEDMAEGRVFLGKKAMDAGLVDAIGDFNTAIKMAKTLTKGNTMKFAEYRTKFPAEAQEGITEILAAEKSRLEKEALATASSQPSPDVEALRGEVKSLKTALETEAQENQKNKKVLAAMEESNLQVTADSILSTALTASSLSAKAQDKVRDMFKGNKGTLALDSYIDESGSLDKTKFGAKVTEEITSFEALVSSDSTTRLPLGKSNVSDSAEGHEEDIAYAQELVSLRYGKQDR
jgi:signal peptide peptidase SppA